MDTIRIEDKYSIPFFNKIPVSIERGEGVYVWDEQGRKYLDFTSGWGVTCIGHSHPAIVEALTAQAGKIIQNPSSGLTYSPVRARLLSLMAEILPKGLTHVFFTNSGAEANDAAIKLARKVSGRLDVISTDSSFHGRTISTASATGQTKHRDKFRPLMPNYRFVPYNDVDALEKAMDEEAAAVILEPIQGEGGVNEPSPGYLEAASDLCVRNGSYLIVDEVQTGFCRTGPMFAVEGLGLKVDFLTLAKGIAGGFPFGAFAVSEEIAGKIAKGDHGGTYCGNPLGCAVAFAVISYLRENRVAAHVQDVGTSMKEGLLLLRQQYPGLVKEVRGKGLLLAMELRDGGTAGAIYQEGIRQGLLLNLTQEKVIRLFPALTITRQEADEGMEILAKILQNVGSGSRIKPGMTA